MAPIERSGNRSDEAPGQAYEGLYRQLIEGCIKKIDEILDENKEKLVAEEYSIKTYNFLRKYGHIE